VVEGLHRTVGEADLGALPRVAHILHAGAGDELHACLLHCGLQPLQHEFIAPVHVAEHLALEAGAPRRIHARDDRPDERGAGQTVVLAELALEQRQPDFFVDPVARPAAQPGLDGHALERPAIADGGRAQDRQGEARLVHQRQRRESQELEVGRQRMHAAVGVETGARHAPAQVLRQAELVQQAAGVEVGQQDHVIEAVPAEAADRGRRRQPARPVCRLEHRDLPAALREAARQLQPEQAAAHDRNAFSGHRQPCR
jgi:hypothetical protein